MIRHLFNAYDPVLPVFFPGVLFRMMQAEGVQIDELLVNTGLTPESFADESLRISFKEYEQFIRNAIEATGDTHLGWRFGEHINVTSLGILGYAALSSSTYQSAIEAVIQYLKIRSPLFELSLALDTHKPGEAALLIDESLDFGDLRYFLLSSILSGSTHLLIQLAFPENAIKGAELGCPKPEDWDRSRSNPHNSTNRIRCPVEFDAPFNRLRFDSGVLDATLPTADPLTEKSVKEICQQMLSRIEGQSGLVQQVRTYILAHTNDFPGLDSAAAYFCVSPRTLRRELSKSGTTYQGILDKVRETIAIELLRTTRKTIGDIGLELGFEDQSNFGRAFKRWTGKAPSEFRRH
ncbi:MAG: hypothetical protein CSB48_01645 [Proteobacteria bacterium]|nr:MAG: hypothetical protein CSB48_01645 [Pseudomonadota bacterium]PIE40240.1 MAG: hypothetical protein CSA51_01810 [Gammaproteobacteria bacterium]